VKFTIKQAALAALTLSSHYKKTQLIELNEIGNKRWKN